MRKRNRFLTILAVLGACILSSAALTASADGTTRWQSSISQNADGNICIDFEEVRVLLPADWSGKCRFITSDNEVSFYHIRSRDLWTQELGYANGGWLFSIHYTQSYDYLDWPDYQTLGMGTDGIYFASFPTDMQAYVHDTAAYNEYISLSNDLDWIRSNMSLTVASALSEAMSGDYIFPQSSVACLSDSDLDGLNADQVQMAINEIYARHHRRFVLPEVQEYFNGKSWYTGYIEAADFDVSVMNACESANINLMVQHLNQADDDQNITILPNTTEDAYGMIIDCGADWFRIRIEDGSSIKFWYDYDRLSSQGFSSDSLQIGAVTSLIYDTESYEALSVLVW